MIKENIAAIVRDDINEGTSSEAIWVGLRKKTGMIILPGLYYRPPNSQWKLEEEICWDIAISCKTKMVAMDFPNIDSDCHLRA